MPFSWFFYNFTALLPLHPCKKPRILELYSSCVKTKGGDRHATESSNYCCQCGRCGGIGFYLGRVRLANQHRHHRGGPTQRSANPDFFHPIYLYSPKSSRRFLFSLKNTVQRQCAQLALDGVFLVLNQLLCLLRQWLHKPYKFKE